MTNVNAVANSPLPDLPPMCDLKDNALSRLAPFDRIRVVMVNVARITCEKCGWTWHEPIPKKWSINHYGELNFAPTVRTTPHCSHCSTPERQPKEGDTFNRPRAMGRGKIIFVDDRGRDRDGFDAEPVSVDKKLSELAQDSWAFCEQERLNREFREREEILTPGWIRERASPEKIRRASWLLTHASRATLARMFELSEHEVRAGRTGRLLALLDAAERA